MQTYCYTSKPFRKLSIEGPSVFLVVADGPTFIDDVKRYEELPITHTTVCCVNRGVIRYFNYTEDAPHFCYSWHETWFPRFINAETIPVFEDIVRVSCWQDSISRDCFGTQEWLKSEGRLDTKDVLFVNLSSTAGSSTLQAVRFGLEVLKFDKIIVVGAPLSGDYRRYVKAWTLMSDEEKDKVRAFGGTTQEILGVPNGKWLKE